MSRMLNRLRDADSNRDDNKKKRNPFDAVVTKAELPIKDATMAEKSQSDSSETEPGKPSPDTEPTGAQENKNDAAQKEVPALDPDPKECRDQAHASNKPLPSERTEEVRMNAPADPAADEAPSDYAALDEGVGHAEVSALFDAEEDLIKDLNRVHSSEARTKSGSSVKLALLAILIFLVGGTVLFLGISKPWIIDKNNDTALVSTPRDENAPVPVVTELVVPQVETIRFHIADFDEVGNESALSVFRARSSFVRGLKPELNDYALNLAFIQNGTNPYPAIFEYALQDVSIEDYSDLSISLRGSGQEGYPLRASLTLYRENEKYEKNLGWLAEDWKRYTIPLSSFDGLPADATLLKMRIQIEQPRQLNSTYDVFIDDIALIGSKKKE
jgi:hypothetical protein